MKGQIDDEQIRRNRKKKTGKSALFLESDDKNINLDEIEKELRELDEEEKEIRRRQEIIEGMNNNAPTKRQKPGEATNRANGNIYDSEEYRNAFMNYVCRGVAIPKEYRADTVTQTTDIGALVPPVTLNKIIEKIEAYGMILPLVTRTAYKTGMVIPTSSVKPVATWVAEGAGSDKQKKALDGTITFGHFKLRCAVAVTIETGRDGIQCV